MFVPAIRLGCYLSSDDAGMKLFWPEFSRLKSYSGDQQVRAEAVAHGYTFIPLVTPQRSTVSFPPTLWV